MPASPLIDNLLRLTRQTSVSPDDDGSCTLVFDGLAVTFRERQGRLLLRHDLPALPEPPEDRQNTLARLLSYTLARSAAHPAILACEPQTATPLLWDTLPPDADDDTITSRLENFLADCEWWQARLRDDDHDTGSSPSDNLPHGTLFFRP